MFKVPSVIQKAKQTTLDQTQLPTRSWLRSLWDFSRPHTIIGTTLSVLALAAMALVSAKSVAWPSFSIALGQILAALVPSLCANIYIVGLNQLEDIEIDRINKPDLPLASGAFSVAEGRWIVSVTALLALVFAGLQGAELFGTVVLSMAIGTAYSLPPLRLKRFPFWAALCIFGVRGGVVNLGFFAHFRQLWGDASLRVWQAPAEVWALTAFVVLFAFAIAIFKDIPDAKGDLQFQIRTLTVRLGARFVFNLSRWVLTLCYGLLIGLTLTGILAVQPWVLVGSHLTLVGLLWRQSTQVDVAQKQEMSRFYQFIWRLFFLEYLLFPIACWIR
ncbi:MAG: homogentisate phytyltransferase [Synechococcales cyanobacterium CRU_2_2]|nr:homogentisate phytyltransferase [Synechococcales cyanobacterium CRU_2_2]